MINIDVIFFYLKTQFVLASAKLQINGSSLVLESNGTPIDEEILPYVKSEILLLLESNEIWRPIKNEAENRADSNSSLPSTITVTSSLANEEAKESESSSSDKSQQELDISYIVNCNSEHYWSSVEVPWNQLSSQQIEELDNGIKNRFTMSTLIHATVNELRQIKYIIPTKAFKLMAKKIIEKYPDIFRDVDEDGIVLGDGSHSLVCKLQDRNNYLNRPHKRKSNENNSPNPVKVQKRYLAARAGCPNWWPDDSEKPGTSRKEPIMIIEGSEASIYQLLQESYSAQRSFINEIPPILEVKEKWPIMFSKLAIFWHFNKLTNSDIHLIDGITEKKEKFKKFLDEKLKPNVDVEEDEITLKVILMKLALYFKENVKALYGVHKVNRTVKSIL